MAKFLLWCILLVLCWPLALLALVVYPIVWILLIPFRLAGIAVQGVLGLLRGLVTFPARLLNGPRAENTAAVKAGNLLLLLNDDAELIVAKASRSGFDPIVRYTVADSATWAQPTISGNRIFIKDVTSLSLWTID